MTEDVTTEVSNVRKVGIISVSYRVVDASSSRVLFTDSMQTKQEFQDEGRQGVQLGDFKQETDFVELPPDIEILSGSGGLADQISGRSASSWSTSEGPGRAVRQRGRPLRERGRLSFRGEQGRILDRPSRNQAEGQGALKSDLKRYAMDSPAL